VIERRPTDPMRKYIKACNQQHDLFIAAFGAIERGLREVATSCGSTAGK